MGMNRHHRNKHFWRPSIANASAQSGLEVWSPDNGQANDTWTVPNRHPSINRPRIYYSNHHSPGTTDLLPSSHESHSVNHVQSYHHSRPPSQQPQHQYRASGYQKSHYNMMHGCRHITPSIAPVPESASFGYSNHYTSYRHYNYHNQHRHRNYEHKSQWPPYHPTLPAPPNASYVAFPSLSSVSSTRSSSLNHNRSQVWKQTDSMGPSNISIMNTTPAQFTSSSSSFSSSTTCNLSSGPPNQHKKMPIANHRPTLATNHSPVSWSHVVSKNAPVSSSPKYVLYSRQPDVDESEGQAIKGHRQSRNEPIKVDVGESEELNTSDEVRDSDAPSAVGNGSRSKRSKQKINREAVLHHLIMYFVEQLEFRGGCTQAELLETYEYSTHRLLHLVTSGESVKYQLHAFLLQHPSIFTLHNNGRFVTLTSMRPDLDEHLDRTADQRALQTLILRITEHGKVKVNLFSLQFKLQSEPKELKRFWIDRSTLISFIHQFPGELVLSDQDNFVALKQVYEQSVVANKPLLKSNEMQIDMNLLQRTVFVTSADEAVRVMDQVTLLLSQHPNRFVAMDMEGVSLGSETGFLTLVQMAVTDVPIICADQDGQDRLFEAIPLDRITVYVFDIMQDERILHVMSSLFADKRVVKVFHGCANDMLELEKYNIRARNVFDTLVASRFLHDSGRQNIYALYELYTGEETNQLKKKIKKIYFGAPDIWARRPLDNKLLYYAALDAYALLQTYVAMKQKMHPEQHHQLDELMQASRPKNRKRK